jgi:hypothetical protein
MPNRRPDSKLIYRAIRLIKGLGHGSIFVLLALPFVTLSTCSGPSAETSGYQALAGATFPAGTLELHQSVQFGPDWWVAAIMVLAVVGAWFAWRGGFKGATAGLGVAILGLAALLAAIAFFATVQGFDFSADPGNGALSIALVFACSVFLDLLWISWRSWSEIWRNRKASWPERGDWFALGLVATFFLLHIGAALTALAIVAIASNSHA